MFFKGRCKKGTFEIIHIFYALDFNEAREKYEKFRDDTLPNYEIVKVAGLKDFEGIGLREDEFLLVD